MLDNKQMLGNAPIGKLLFKLALPTVVAQLVNMFYNVVDRMFIGHMPENGELALTGVGVCMPIIMIVSAFAALVGSGGAPKASILLGKQDSDSAEKILGGCFSLQIIISVILTTVLLIWNKELLMAFGASKNTIEFATDYMDRPLDEQKMVKVTVETFGIDYGVPQTNDVFDAYAWMLQQYGIMGY